MDKDIIIKLFEKKEYKAIKSIFGTMNPVDTATLLPEFDEKEMVILFRLIPKENAAMAIADGEQLSLAIGRKGQNVRLASRLTKYRIDVKTSAELKEMGINIGFE